MDKRFILYSDCLLRSSAAPTAAGLSAVIDTCARLEMFKARARKNHDALMARLISLGIATGFRGLYDWSECVLTPRMRKMSGLLRPLHKIDLLLGGDP